jgi:hypothetical protein
MSNAESTTHADAFCAPFTPLNAHIGQRDPIDAGRELEVLAQLFREIVSETGAIARRGSAEVEFETAEVVGVCAQVGCLSAHFVFLSAQAVFMSAAAGFMSAAAGFMSAAAGFISAASR